MVAARMTVRPTVMTGIGVLLPVTAMMTRPVPMARAAIVGMIARTGMMFAARRRADAALVELDAAVPDRARTGRIVARRLARAVVGALVGRTGTDQAQSGDGGKQEQFLHDRPPSTRRR